MPKILKVVAWILALRKDFDVRAMTVINPEGDKGWFFNKNLNYIF